MAKLKALLLTGGYHGMISQVEGLAKALKVEFHHKIVRLNWLWNYIPPKFTPKSEIILKDKYYVTNTEKIDLIISCGRKSVIPSILLKKKNKNIFTIHIQDPKVSFNNFDLIVALANSGIILAAELPTSKVGICIEEGKKNSLPLSRGFDKIF